PGRAHRGPAPRRGVAAVGRGPREARTMSPEDTPPAGTEPAEDDTTPADTPPAEDDTTPADTPPAEDDTTPADTEPAEDDEGDEDGDTFPRSYVKRLRERSAGYRARA